MDPWGWFFMSLLWLTLIVVVALIGVTLLQVQRRRDDDVSRFTPEDILAGRLARGEIDVATYDELRRKVQEAGSQSSIGASRRDP